MTVTVVAVDFGASSIRVCRVDLGESARRVEVVHRHAHTPVVDSGGTLRWDWERLTAELEHGLDLALSAGPVASIGIDTWGVDYGLVDARGRLVEPPISYRDRRTQGYRDVVERIGEARLYGISGLQMMPINTIFQVAAHDSAALGRAAHLLMLPELLVHHLTGEVVAERSSAGTTGLVDLATGDWSPELCDCAGLDRGLLAEILPAGTPVGTWCGVPVHLVGGHDTASAVAAGAVAGDAFVSAGTWLLVGREQTRPDTSEGARLAGFTNEQGALGGIRFLRNVAGWWLFDECRRAWGEPDAGILLDEAAAVSGDVPVFAATDERFLAPADMEAEIRAAAGLGRDAGRAAVTRCVVESMAASAAGVVDRLGVGSVRLFGGGARSGLLVEALRRRGGLPVTVGPVEATALGNAMVQGIALGVWDTLADARAAVGSELRW